MPVRQPTAEELLSRGNLPRHIAIIMDGNGRWARARGVPRMFGHRAGRESVRESVKGCVALGEILPQRQLHPDQEAGAHRSEF